MDMSVFAIFLLLVFYPIVDTQEIFKIGVINQVDTWDINLQQISESLRDNGTYSKTILHDEMVTLNFTVEEVHQKDYTNIVNRVCSILEEGYIGLVSYVGCPLATIFDWLSREHSIPNVMFVKEPCYLSNENADTIKFLPNCFQRNDVFRDIAETKAWDRVVILFDETFGSKCLQDLIMKFSKVSTRSRFVDIKTVNHEELNRLNQQDARRMFVIVSDEALSKLLSMAKSLNMFGTDYFWVVSTDNTDLPDITSLNLDDGNIVVVRKLLPEMYDEDEKCLQMFDGGATSSESMAYLVDAGALYVDAIKRELTKPFPIDFNSVNCTEDNHFQVKHGPVIRQNLQMVNLEGTTGTLRFSDRGYPLVTKYQLCSTYRSSNGTLTHMGEWNEHGLQLNNEQIFRNTFRDFGNKTLTIATQLANPFNVKVVDNGTVTFTGYSFDILNELATRFKFRYKLVEPEDGLWGGPNEDGTWNGMVGMVMRGEVDFAVGPFTITSIRETVIDFGKPIMEDGVGIITKRPDGESDKMYKLFKPFTPPVWGCIALSIIVVGVMLYFVTRFSPYSTNNKRHGHPTVTEEIGLSSSLWLIYGSYMEQGVEPHPSSVSGRCILGFWWLFTILMTSTYTANLAAFLTVSIAEKPINTLAELAAQDEIKPLIKVGTNLHTLFKKAESGVYKEIWDKMADMPTIKTAVEGLNMVKQGEYAYMTDRSQLEYIVLKDCETYALADEIFNTAGLGFVFPENAPYLEDFNYSIMRMQEAGLMEKWRQKWWSSADQCTPSDRTSSAKILGLDSLAGPFLMYLSVVVLSFFCLVIEICIKNRPCVGTKPTKPISNGTSNGIHNGSVNHEIDIPGSKLSVMTNNL